jgi:hypothetical protein
MPFGRKKVTGETNYDQTNISTLAADALKKRRNVRVRLAVRLTFDTPILMQRWTTKSVRQMLGNMVGMPQPRMSKNLTQDYEDSWYRNVKGEPIIPCRIIKAALVSAGGPVVGNVVTKADLKRTLRVIGFTAPLRFKGEKEMSIKIVRNDNGKPDVRSRAQFPVGTTCEVVLEFGHPLTPDSIVAALEGAGTAVGIGEFRPESGGELGTFSVEILPSDAKTIDRICRANSVPEDEFVIPPEMLKAFEQIADEKLPDPGRKVRSSVRRRAIPHEPVRSNGSAHDVS